MAKVKRHPDDNLDEAIGAYINAMEATVCGEFHTDEWPDCTDERHEAGRWLLAEFDIAPKGWREDKE